MFYVWSASHRAMDVSTAQYKNPGVVGLYLQQVTQIRSDNKYLSLSLSWEGGEQQRDTPTTLTAFVIKRQSSNLAPSTSNQLIFLLDSSYPTPRIPLQLQHQKQLEKGEREHTELQRMPVNINYSFLVAPTFLPSDISPTPIISPDPLNFFQRPNRIPTTSFAAIATSLISHWSHVILQLWRLKRAPLRWLSTLSLQSMEVYIRHPRAPMLPKLMLLTLN